MPAGVSANWVKQKQKQNILGRGSRSVRQRLKIPKKEHRNNPSPQGRQANERHRRVCLPEKEEGLRGREESLETQKICIWVTRRLARRPLGDRRWESLTASGCWPGVASAAGQGGQLQARRVLVGLRPHCKKSASSRRSLLGPVNTDPTRFSKIT